MSEQLEKAVVDTAIKYMKVRDARLWEMSVPTDPNDADTQERFVRLMYEENRHLEDFRAATRRLIEEREKQ